MLSRLRQAADRYGMIESGDVVAVGLSGGKDSVALLTLLAEMRRFYPKRFEVKAITVDMGFDGTDGMFDPLIVLCGEIGVEHHIEKTQIASIVFNERQEKNPCSLCAKLRRGALVDSAKRLGANKLALAHHVDDAAETFMMNLINEGRLGCYSPVTLYEDKSLCVLRPLVMTREAEIIGYVRAYNLPIVKSPCPEDKMTLREETKSLIRQVEKLKPGFRKQIIRAMEKSGLDGWGFSEKENNTQD